MLNNNENKEWNEFDDEFKTETQPNTTPIKNIFNEDFSDVQGDFPEFPYGVYPVEIVSFEMDKESKDGDKLMTKIEVKVVGEGAMAGQHDWIYFVTQGNKVTSTSKLGKENPDLVGKPNLDQDRRQTGRVQTILFAFDIKSFTDFKNANNLAGQQAVYKIEDNNGFKNKSIKPVQF